MKFRKRKILKRVLVSVLILLVATIVFERISQVYFNTKRPGESEFVETNGLKTHFVKKGTGGPTVVFQSGLGGDYKIWEEIQDTLSKYATTISYDRAGILWSDLTEETKTLDNITEELTRLLEKTDCPKPYILVGHSLAGITLRPFVARHQQDVKSVIFVDVTHPLQIKNASEELKKYLITPPEWLVATLVETGILRCVFHFKGFIGDVPASHWLNRHIRNYFYLMYKATLKEANEDDVMFAQAEEISAFGDIPLTVISGGYPSGADFLGDPKLVQEYLGLHRAGQKDLLSMSTASKQVIARNSGHYVQLQDPEVIIDAIKEYVKP